VTTGTQTLYDWLLFLHVLAAMVWVGGGVMLAVLAARVVRDPDPGAVGRFTSSLRVLGPLVLAPATVAVLGLGIWLVVDSEAWDFGQLWVQLGLGLFVAAFLVGAVWQSRSALLPHAPPGVRTTRRHAVITPAGFERYFDRIAARISGAEPPPEASRPIPEVITLGPPLGEAQT
jgi:uncharacterized membrane protein